MREEFHTLLEIQERELDPVTNLQLAPFRVTPSIVPCIRSASLEADVMWVVARAGNVVLLYDSVEEEFGTGTLNDEGHIIHWGTCGEKLKWSVPHFLEESK